MGVPLSQQITNDGWITVQGTWHWLAHHNQDNFFKDREGLQRLMDIAEVLQVPLHHERQGHCTKPECEMVVSWDAKVTLCTREIQLLNTIGDANHVELADIWHDVVGLQGQCRSVGRPQRQFCRDCGMFEMPGLNSQFSQRTRSSNPV